MWNTIIASLSKKLVLCTYRSETVGCIFSATECGIKWNNKYDMLITLFLAKCPFVFTDLQLHIKNHVLYNFLDSEKAIWRGVTVLHWLCMNACTTTQYIYNVSRIMHNSSLTQLSYVIKGISHKIYIQVCCVFVAISSFICGSISYVYIYPYFLEFLHRL